MLSLRKHWPTTDHVHLSAKINGTAVNIATNQFCWQVLYSHAQFLPADRKHFIAFVELMDKAVAYLDSELGKMMQKTEFMIAETEPRQKKARIAVLGTLNLITQQDQRTSIATVGVGTGE